MPKYFIESMTSQRFVVNERTRYFIRFKYFGIWEFMLLFTQIIHNDVLLVVVGSCYIAFSSFAIAFTLRAQKFLSLKESKVLLKIFKNCKSKSVKWPNWPKISWNYHLMFLNFIKYHNFFFYTIKFHLILEKAKQFD